MYVKNYGQYGQKWLKGQIVTLRGPVSATVELTDGSKIRRHFDQMRKRHSESSTTASTSSQDLIPESFLPFCSDGPSDSNGGSGEVQSEEPASETVTNPSQEALSPSPELNPLKTYPTRIRGPPNCLVL